MVTSVTTAEEMTDTTTATAAASANKMDMVRGALAPMAIGAVGAAVAVFGSQTVFPTFGGRRTTVWFAALAAIGAFIALLIATLAQSSTAAMSGFKQDAAVAKKDFEAYALGRTTTYGDSTMEGDAEQEADPANQWTERTRYYFGAQVPTPTWVPAPTPAAVAE